MTTHDSSAPRLLNLVRDRIRRKHYSIRTEEAYLHWVKAFVRFHGMRHPSDMRAAEAESFLTYLAVQRNVSSTTQNQALSGLLFLYREVLEIELPWLDGIQRSKWPKRMPVVRTRDEVIAVLQFKGSASFVSQPELALPRQHWPGTVQTQARVRETRVSWRVHPRSAWHGDRRRPRGGSFVRPDSRLVSRECSRHRL